MAISTPRPPLVLPLLPAQPHTSVRTHTHTHRHTQLHTHTDAGPCARAHGIRRGRGGADICQPGASQLLISAWKEPLVPGPLGR